jgi:hypothetical protein
MYVFVFARNALILQPAQQRKNVITIGEKISYQCVIKSANIQKVITFYGQHLLNLILSFKITTTEIKYCKICPTVAQPI